MSTVRIPLRRRDGSVRAYAVVDAEDAERVLAHRWSHLKGGYVARHDAARPGRPLILLHRVLMGLEPGDPREVDHEDGDGLNNVRSNLRVCTHAENGQNRRGSRRGSASRYRGVSWHKGARKWAATAYVAGSRHYLGLFTDEAEAGAVAAAFRARHMPFSQEGTEAA